MHFQFAISLLFSVVQVAFLLQMNNFVTLFDTECWSYAESDSQRNLISNWKFTKFLQLSQNEVLLCENEFIEKLI